MFYKLFLRLPDNMPEDRRRDENMNFRYASDPE